ncbi:ABC transporter ATP-binding protein [Notoacmeibacter ruber]|uniref:ABC transporter ATP-binding protein n=1 Tax=Notoacmeibacter ruber TaxID=2670375 RepID=A0A3L7J301_9HYPH|nr:ABC transporter ATP-binding protein [Notoacmeibacter ruber]RLQ84996.1 ABC transporter ATP-binding protein [Notoacmeibacter ruber]
MRIALIPKLIRELRKKADQSIVARLVKENFKEHRVNYFLAMISMLVVSGMTAATALIVKNLLEATDDATRMLTIAGVVCAIFIVKGVAGYMQIFMMSKAGFAIVASQRRRIYDALLAQGVSFYDRKKSSDLVARVSRGTDAIRGVIDTLITTYIRDLTSVIGLTAVMIYQLPWVSLLILALGPITVFAIRRILKRVDALSSEELQGYSRIVELIQETAAGINVVKAFSLENQMRRDMHDAVTDVESKQNSLIRLQAATSPIVETLTGVAIASVFMFVSLRSSLGDTASAGQLVSFITALLLVYTPARRIARSRVQLHSRLNMVRRLYDVIDTPLSIQEAEEPKNIALDGAGEVRFENVRFTYGKSKKAALKDLSLVFPSGKFTAIVGPSGSGKSTIINLILRLYDPAKGNVLIDNLPLREASFASLRAMVSYVSQDVFLFADTVERNITAGRQDFTRKQVINAAKAADAHGFIMEMKNGYETVLHDKGSNLSGGQRQRLAIARAIIRQSRILILDEATSSLDAYSEEAIKNAIDELSHNRTTIVVAHRLSTIMKADKVVVIVDGQVAESGSPSELLLGRGVFRELYDKQDLSIDPFEENGFPADDDGVGENGRYDPTLSSH